MVDDHEDYETGAAPAAHKLSHQNGGADEISVAALSGELADDQPPKAHDLGGAKHNADTLANINAKVTGATLDDAGDPRDPNAHKLSHQNGGADKISVAGLLGETADLTTHKGLPTIHQDAPNLIFIHKGDAVAHHARYTDAEARALMSPVSVPPCAFFPTSDAYDWLCEGHYLKNRTTLTTQFFYAPVLFPPGVTVTKLTLYGYRDDALSTLYVILKRVDRVQGAVVMATSNSNWTDGYGSRVITAISYATINNSLYSYILMLDLDPNDHVDDVRLTGVEIEFTG